MSLVVLVAAESPAADLLGLWHIISIASALPGLQTKKKLKMTAKEKKKLILSLTKEMQEASRNLEFERAAQIRDIIFELNEKK